jgi:hypothetical protein
VVDLHRHVRHAVRPIMLRTPIKVVVLRNQLIANQVARSQMNLVRVVVRHIQNQIVHHLHIVDHVVNFKIEKT